MPEEEQLNTDLDNLRAQIGNTVVNILKDQLSPSSLAISFATGGVATWINTALNFTQLVGIAEQTQFVLFTEDARPAGFKTTIEAGEAVLPVIFVKTLMGGALNVYKLKIYTNYEHNILYDDYDEIFTLDTDNLPGIVKPHCLYMLIPRTTSLTKTGAKWDFIQKARGVDGFTINTEGDNYRFELVTRLTLKLGLSEYLVNVGASNSIVPILDLLLSKKD